MKILHCCLSAVYVDNHGYQENILPKMHLIQGHDVMIVASTETIIDSKYLGYVNKGSYLTENNIPITRLPYFKLLPHFITKKLRIYSGLKELIEKFNPDCIFLHDVQFISIYEIVNYAKTHKKITIYADGHTDFINSARNWFSRNILHKIIYRQCAKCVEPYTKKFYGVLPLRVDFFKNVYGISSEKVELLVMGGDLTNVNFEKKDEIKKIIRNSNLINPEDFVIVTGGKIDNQKNIHLLIKAINEIGNMNIKLIIFGNVNIKMKDEIDSLCKSEFIRFVGWVSSEKVYDYFLASDLAFFPGTHSVLWEQSVSVGLPGVFKKWNGIQHIDVGGNALFIEDVNIESIKEMIKKIFNDQTLFDNMKKVAVEKGISYFSYYDIAKRAIE